MNMPDTSDFVGKLFAAGLIFMDIFSIISCGFLIYFRFKRGEKYFYILSIIWWILIFSFIFTVAGLAWLNFITPKSDRYAGVVVYVAFLASLPILIGGGFSLFFKPVAEVKFLGKINFTPAPPTHREDISNINNAQEK